MSRRFQPALLLVVVGAIVLILSLFLTWYNPDTTAWDAFEIVDLLLAGLSVAAATIAVIAFTRSVWDPLLRWLPFIVAAIVAIVVVNLIDPAPAIGDASLEYGGWMALGGSLLMALGAAFPIAAWPHSHDRRTTSGASKSRQP